MKSAVIILAIFVVVLSGVALYSSPKHLYEGWRLGLISLLRMFPILALAMIFSGLIQTMVPTDLLSKWLGGDSGFRGIMLGCVAGALTPGGPVTAFPMVVVLYNAKAGIGTLVAYMTAWSLWSVSRMPMEIAFISPKFLMYRLVSVSFLPPLAGIIAHVFFGEHFK